MLTVNIVRVMISGLPEGLPFCRSVLMHNLPVVEIEFALAKLIEEGFIRSVSGNSDGPFVRASEPDRA